MNKHKLLTYFCTHKVLFSIFSRVFIAFYLLLSFQTASAYSGQLPWLVKVESEYKDVRQKEAQKQLIVGAGVLCKIDERYFVLSVSHLSQGENLRLDLPASGKNLIPKGEAFRLTVSEADLELIEIENPSVNDNKIFHWDSVTEFFLLDDSFENFKTTYKSNYIQASQEYLAIRPPWIKGDVPMDYHQLLKPNLRQLDFWAPVSIYFDWYNLQLVSDSWIVHGMSGAPLISGLKLNGKVNPAIFGLSKSFHRHFPRSYFAGPALIKLIKNFYDEGIRGQRSKIRWSFASGIGLFRYFYEQGLSEINSEEIPTGGGDSAEGGGGDSAEGGGGDSAESGKTILQKLKSANQSYSALGLHAGMRAKSDSILAFKLANSMANSGLFPSGQSISIYADSWGLDYKNVLESYNEGIEWESVREGPTLFPLFLDKVNSRISNINKTDLCTIDSSGFAKGDIKVTLKQFDGRTSKTVQFQLNSYGALSSTRNKNFIPIITAGSPEITVDLKGLFFFSPADIRPTSNETVSTLSALFMGIPYVTYQVHSGGAAYPVFCNVGKAY
ncbi:MAG: hypothetical protein ACXVCP_16120 [Bdellovibrio sp.]